MPTFTAGSDWPTEHSHAAPWAELLGTSFILRVPIEAARLLTNPTGLTNLWDQIQAHNAWLAGLPTTLPAPSVVSSTARSRRAGCTRATR